MCGRYTITVDESTIEYHFNAKFASGQQEFEWLTIVLVFARGLLLSLRLMTGCRN
jgi:hypothetical protein